MKKVECYIVCDLLPLYIDSACSEQTSKDVEAHLQSCDDCRKLYGEMISDICSSLPKPKIESNVLFQSLYKHLMGIAFALALMISCFIINAGGAWEGGPAETGHLITTVVYLVFWSVFSILSRNYKPFINISFIISLLTCISSVNGLVWRFLAQGSFISSFISVFTAVPFYGLRMFLGWTGLYIFASLFSLCWLIYVGFHYRKLEKTL